MSWDGSFPCVRSLGKIFLYVLLVLLGGALAAPQAWHLIQTMPPEWLGGLIGKVQGMPFHRYLSRSLQVAAILLLWPLLRSLRIRSLRELGLLPSPSPGRDLMLGLLIGSGGALFLQAWLIGGGFFGWSGGWSGAVAPRIFLTALVVASMEEFLFRGVVLGFCRQSLAPYPSIVLSSLFFAIVHFFNLPHSAEDGGPHWWSGLSYLSLVWTAFPSLALVLWAFATLSLAGLLLGWLTIRTGALWAAVAMHASWILCQQMFTSAFSFRGGAPSASLPWTGVPQCHGAVPVGLIPLISLALAWVVAGMLLRGRYRASSLPHAGGV